MTLNDRKPIFQGQTILWRKLSHKGLQIQFMLIWQEAQLMQGRRAMPAPIFFVSLGDVPATITQYVAWMERKFNAFQIPRSMYLSVFDSFRVIRCLSQCVSPKIAIFTTFLFPLGTSQGGSRRNSAMTFGMDKLEWLGYPMVKKVWRCLFVSTELTNVIDGQTHRQTDTACRHIPRLCIASRGKNHLHCLLLGDS